MLTRLIQQQVPLGSEVIFFLKTGREVSGVLDMIGRDYITLNNEKGLPKTVLVDMIGGWDVLNDDENDDLKLVPTDKEEPPENDDLKLIPTDKEELPENDDSKSTSTDKDEYERLEKDGSKPVFTDELSIISDEDIKISHPVSTDIQSEVIRKLLEIEASYQAHLQIAKIELKIPDFNIPPDEIQEWRNSEAATMWHRIKNQYEYALRINELSAKFGRIQPIMNELKTLTGYYPNSYHLKRHLAYILTLSGNEKEALEWYQDIAISSSDAQDWFNLAVLALKFNKEELACYSLEQFFQSVSVTDNLNAWYVYINLLKKCNNFSILSNLLETTERIFSENEIIIFLETGIYLLKICKGEKQAAEAVQKWIQGQPLKSVTENILEHFNGEPSESYKKFTMDFMFAERERKKQIQSANNQEPQGYIYTYKREKAYGFIQDLKGNDYFFHKSAVIDDAVLYKLDKWVMGNQIPVIFETAKSPKGTLAIQISQPRTIDEIFKLAQNYTDDGDYSKAISQIKRVLLLNPDYPHAQELYEKWKEYVQANGVPKGSNPFARAKRAQLIEKDFEKTIKLFQEAIKKNDNAESAVKDLAMLLVQLNRMTEAVDVLEKNHEKITNQKSFENHLINIYKKAGQHEKAITILERNLKTESNQNKKASILSEMANSCLRMENYKKSEQIFRQILKLRPDNIPAQRNIALCLSKQKHYDEAEGILNKILNIYPDGKSVELKEAIDQAKTTGKSAEIDQIIIEITLSDFSNELSNFTKFFLDRCVPPERMQSQTFSQSDIRELEGLATKLGTSRPKDRAGYYLSAAKIVSILEEYDDSNQFYRYLCRSFASKGYATLTENRHIDSAREWYCEALSVYDGDHSQRKDEQDAVNALVSFLFSTLGRERIPLPPKIPSIDETIEEVINFHPQRDKVFDAIAYLVLRSRYAANRILNRLNSKSTLQAMSLEYLRNKEISVPTSLKRSDDFVQLWNQLRRKKADESRNIFNELRFLNNVKLTTAFLEHGIERVKSIEHSMFFDLDQQRTGVLRSFLEIALELCRQFTFEERERLCIQIDNRCQDILKEIEESPTKLSIEEIYPVVKVIQEKVKERLKELYETSKPQLTLRLAIESYPDNNQIEVQIAVANQMGCSPSESLRLIVKEDKEFFTANTPEIRLDESLRGGDQRIVRIPLILTNHALASQTFSLSVNAQYRTRSGDTEKTSVESFSIRLYSEDEFEEIDNPYAAYAEGGPVNDPEMFYGREKLIQNIARTIKESRLQSKCIIVFGQKRAGKSSILYHLKTLLTEEKDLIILDVGNIGAIIEENSSTPFLYQILWSILRELKDEIENRVENSFNPLNLDFPGDIDFYNHPSPLMCFNNVFDSYRKTINKKADWQNTRIVVLIDEFSYIYNFVLSGQLPESFMKNWKALLQKNYFNAVLAGQDVMPKFKQRFPNEFGTTQDERVTYLRREDAEKLIDEPIRIGGRQGESRYRERAIERIIHLTAGSPFYIQIICNRLVEYMNRKCSRLVTEADIEQIKNDLIRGVNSLGLDKFDNLINSGDTSKDAISDEDALNVLKSVAKNSQTGTCNRNSVVCETLLSVDLILDDLVKREVIKREREHYYRIRVGIFKEWLMANM